MKGQARARRQVKSLGRPLVRCPERYPASTEGAASAWLNAVASARRTRLARAGKNSLEKTRPRRGATTKQTGAILDFFRPENSAMWNEQIEPSRRPEFCGSPFC
jgi:hypothetical protein